MPNAWHYQQLGAGQGLGQGVGGFGWDDHVSLAMDDQGRLADAVQLGPQVSSGLGPREPDSGFKGGPLQNLQPPVPDGLAAGFGDAVVDEFGEGCGEISL